MYFKFEKIITNLILITLLKYLLFYLVLKLSLRFKTRLFFMLITILIRINSINYIIFINITKIYKM